MTSTLSATFLVQPDPGDSLAILADGQLSVAALEALIVRDRPYRVAMRARGVEAIRMGLASLAPAILVVESRSNDWHDALPAAGPRPKTLLLLDPELDAVPCAPAVGGAADECLSRTASREAFGLAIARLRERGSYLDRVLAEPVGHQRARALSPRERDILVEVASGRSSKEIARQHAIAAKTVCNHVYNICQKLHLRHRGQLVLYAAQHGLTSP